MVRCLLCPPDQIIICITWLLTSQPEWRNNNYPSIHYPYPLSPIQGHGGTIIRKKKSKSTESTESKYLKNLHKIRVPWQNLVISPRYLNSGVTQPTVSYSHLHTLREQMDSTPFVYFHSPSSHLGTSLLQVRSHWHMRISEPTSEKPG